MKRNILIAIIGCFLIGITQIAAAENPIGLLLEGYEKGCEIQRKGKAETIKCEYKMELFEGDEIVKSPDVEAIKIQWLSPPYTHAEKISKTRLKVVFDRPEEKTIILSIFEHARTFLGLVKTSHVRSSSVTKGKTDTTSEVDDDIIVPRPGYNATVLPGYPVTFAWGKKGGNVIVFKDIKGKIIFQKDINDKTSIQLNPKQIGLKPSELYTWDVEGVRLYSEHKVRVLKDETAQQIKSDLKKIDGYDISDDEKKIQKATYLQLRSDLYPKEIDIYWLSYELLKRLKDNDIAKELRKRYLVHLDETFIGK